MRYINLHLHFFYYYHFFGKIKMYIYIYITFTHSRLATCSRLLAVDRVWIEPVTSRLRVRYSTTTPLHPPVRVKTLTMCYPTACRVCWRRPLNIQEPPLIHRSDYVPDDWASCVCVYKGSYFAGIMLMCSLSVVCTVLVLNYHHRSPDTHQMPRWVATVTLYCTQCHCHLGLK